MITEFNWFPEHRGFSNNRYFSAGQIIQVQTVIEFAVGGLCNINIANNSFILIADAPVFQYMQAGNTFRIVRQGATSDHQILEKIDDYTVRIADNLNLSNVNAFICLETSLTTAFPNFRVYFNHGNIPANDFISLQSQYEIGFEAYTPPSNNTLPYSAGGSFLTPYHKNIDRNIHPYWIGYLEARRDMFNRTGVNGIRTFRVAFGINNSTLALYNAKATTDVASNVRRFFWHINPFLPDAEGYELQSSITTNLKFRFQNIANSNVFEINIPFSTQFDQFGYFGELGNGQVPQFKPINILINGVPNGFLFVNTPQTLQFDIPLNSNNTNEIVYIVFQRKCTNFEDLNPNLTYQENWGVSPIFSRPTGTTVQIGLIDVLVVGQCQSVNLVGVNYRYTFQFTIDRLAELITWKEGLICYLVIDNPTYTESHVLFEAKYEAPIIPIDPPILNDFQVKPYETIELINDELFISMVPSLFLWGWAEIDITPIPYAKFKKVEAVIYDKDLTFELQRYETSMIGHQYDSNGYAVFYQRTATQGGNFQNHPSSFFIIDAQFGSMRINVPLLQRLEDWLSLQPNNGDYFDITEPNNGQNYNFSRYKEAIFRIRLYYELGGANYNFDAEKKLYFHDIDTPIYPPSAPDSSIIGVVNLDNTPVTTYYAGNSYKLRLANRIPYPDEYCVSIRAVYVNVDNQFTWGTWYPDDSQYKPLNTYSKVFTLESPDNYVFTLPNRAGLVRFYVIFTKNAGFVTPPLWRDNMITRVFEIEVKNQPELQVTNNAVITSCCETILVTSQDFTTIAIPMTTGLVNLYLNNEPIVVLEKTEINNLVFVTIDWSEVYDNYGEGCYKIVSENYESIIYELFEFSDAVANGTIKIEFELNKKIGNFDFKNYPQSFCYRLKGWIESDSATSESEEIQFDNGNTKKIKQEISRNYNVIVKKILVSDYQLLHLGLAADKWVISDYNKRNPLNYRGVEILPPSEISPEWYLDTNFGSFEFESKSIKYLKTDIC